MRFSYGPSDTKMAAVGVLLILATLWTLFH